MKILILILLSLYLTACSTQPPKEQGVFARAGHRGGSSTGQIVNYQEGMTKGWKSLKTQGLNKKEKDRRAILALSGEYKTKFNFLETFNVKPDKKLDTPYTSWGTEFVRVIEQSNDFISLQHIMVMYYIDSKTDKKMGPIVMKHWRQDWHWQAENILEYTGSNSWKKRKLASNEKEDKWVWSVYQVDDSPRYSGIGEWKHYKSLSVFHVPDMSRPLPRRERSYRRDYDVLIGSDDIILTPYAWYHEQKSFKHNGNVSEPNDFNGEIIAREVGHNSYRPIIGTDFSLGYEYWKNSSGYWGVVRKVWKDIIAKGDFKMKKKINDTPLFAFHFDHATDPLILKMNASQQEKIVRELLDKFLK